MVSERHSEIMRVEVSLSAQMKNEAARLGNLAIDIRKTVCPKCQFITNTVIHCDECHFFLKTSKDLLVRLFRSLWLTSSDKLTEKELFALRFKYPEEVEAYRDPNSYVSSRCK